LHNEVIGTGNVINAYNILVREPDGKRSLARPRCKWEDITKVDLGEIWFECGLNSSGSDRA
jgi:hypothetical protein